MHDRGERFNPVDDIMGLSRRIRNAEVSPVDLVTACQARIEVLQPKLNAFITVMLDAALEKARSAQAEIRSGNWRGPLHGIPIAVKDFYDTAGVRTTAAFAPFKQRLPDKNAAAVDKLENAGAIILGKTNLHTLGMGTTGLESAFGPVSNPWSAQHIPGGSSSGSAAAVASGMCYVTLDTDAIGSCRLPAACCGVVGFKGTYGLIGMEGILAGEQPPPEEILWLSHAGIMTRSAQDTALVLDVLAESATPGSNVSYAADLDAGRRLRLGLATNAKPPKSRANHYSKAVELLRNLGHDVVAMSVPLVEPGRGIAKIEADRKAIRDCAFRDVDLFILPTIPGETPMIASCMGNPLALSPAYTGWANYYGLPAITVPCGRDERGLPVGLQFVGPPQEDRTVLQVAYAFERAYVP